VSGTRRILVALAMILVALLGVDGAGTTAAASSHAAAGCSPARVQYAPHPRVERQLSTLPWMRGKPAQVGLVGLIWYWPTEWRAARVRTARIFAGGKAPAGYSTKILWTFVPRSGWAAAGGRLFVHGTRVDGEGTFSQEFAAISFSGQAGPSFASIVDVPEPGCWRLELSTGQLRASLVLLAISPVP
jgi:hypothetical protein